MLTFRPADQPTQALIDGWAQMSPKMARSWLGTGAGMVGDVFSELTKSRTAGGAAIRHDSPQSPWSTDFGEPLWKGSAKIRFDDAEALAASNGSSISDGSMAIVLGGSKTVVTGNLAIYEEHLLFSPHGSWQNRGVGHLRVDTGQPIQYSGIVADQNGARALAVMLRATNKVLVFRIGMILKGLDALVAARLAPS